MKQITLLFTLFFSTMLISAQDGANLVVFSETGDKFTLFLNGVQQNDAPQVNVKATFLQHEFYNARVEFENGEIKPLSKSVATKKGMEVVYVIKTNNKGNYVLRYKTETPLPQPETVQASEPAAQPQAAPQQAAESTTTITQTTNMPANGESVNISMNMGGQQVGVNMQVSGTTTSTSTTTTTTTTTSGGSMPQQNVQAEPAIPGYKGKIGCEWPMDEGEFNNALSSIKSKDFEDSKLTVAKQVTSANCLTSDQVKRIAQTFTFEDNKLEYTKFAYPNTYDQSNYYKLNDVFDFEMTIDELNEYIQSR